MTRAGAPDAIVKITNDTPWGDPMSQTLLDPTNESKPVERARVARLDAISGRTIGLLDISKPRGDVFLNRVEERLGSLGANTIRYIKPTFARPAPVDLRHQIATECDAVIEALAD